MKNLKATSQEGSRAAKRQSIVEVRIVAPGVRSTYITAYSSFFIADGDDLVLRSALAPAVAVSDHLKWLHGMLQRERKKFRQLQEDGVETICRIRVRSRKFEIEPEALLLMHQLHLRTEISLHP